MPQKKRALILGISGQDGGYLSKLLLDKGYEVHGTSRDCELSQFNNLKKLAIFDGVQVHSCSLSDFQNVFMLLEELRPDEIYNLAGQSSVGLSFSQPQLTFESLAVSTINLLEAIRVSNLPTLFFNPASGECFGNCITPATERTQFHPRSPYAIAKATAYWTITNYRESYGLFACSGILFNHESPLRPERFVTQKIVSAAVRISRGSAEKLQLGNIDIRRDWGWSPEYVLAMWKMLQMDTPQDLIIATGKSYTLRNFLENTFGCLRLNWRDHIIFEENLTRPNELMESHADPTRADEVINWKAECQFPELIERLIECEKAGTPI